MWVLILISDFEFSKKPPNFFIMDYIYSVWRLS